MTIIIIIIMTGIAISGDSNMVKKETEIILKYKELTMEIEWNVQTKAIPVIIGENGTVSGPFGQYLSNVEGKREIKELRKQLYWSLHIL